MLPNSKNIGFLFDLDGVLIDSERQYTEIWAKINREFPSGIEGLEHIIKGCTLSKILEENYNSETIRIAVANRLHELESKMHYNFLPFAKEFLVNLKERQLPCVLVTSSDNKKMHHLREEIPEIEDYFEYIVTGNQVKESKPSPEGYLLGASKINADPRNCVVFEDSLQGVMAGKNAGSYVVGVKGTIPVENLASFSHIVIDNFNDIVLEDLIQILTER